MFLVCVPPFQLGPLISGLPQPPGILQSLLQSFPFLSLVRYSSPPPLLRTYHTRISSVPGFQKAWKQPVNGTLLFQRGNGGHRGNTLTFQFPIAMLGLVLPSLPSILSEFFSLLSTVWTSPGAVRLIFYLTGSLLNPLPTSLVCPQHFPPYGFIFSL